MVLNPGDISSALGSISSPRRADPLRVNYPSRVLEEMNIEMFEDWSLDVKTETTRTKFFQLLNQPSVNGSHMQINYDFEALQDRVEPSEFPSYAQAVKGAQDSLGYTLRYSTPAQLEKTRKPGTFNWAVASAALCFFGSAMVVAFRYFRKSKLASPRPPPLEATAALNGIGGWLILLAIAQLLRPLGYIKVGFDLFPTLIKTAAWRSLTDPIEASYHAWWAPSLLFELFFNLAGFVFCGLLLALFFGKRAAWLRCFAVLLSVSLLGIGFEVFLVDHIPSAAESLVTPSGRLCR